MPEITIGITKIARSAVFSRIRAVSADREEERDDVDHHDRDEREPER